MIELNARNFSHVVVVKTKAGRGRIKPIPRRNFLAWGLGGGGGSVLQYFEIKRLRNALLSISRGIFLQKSQSWAKIKTKQLPPLASC